MNEPPAIEVDVVLAFAERQYRQRLQLGRTRQARRVLQLAEAAGLGCAAAGLDVATVPLGVFGERVSDDYLLQSGDRLEVYRPLHQDPKELRRARAGVRRPRRR